MNDFAYYVAAILVVLVVLPVHEFAHAYVAYLNGDRTAKDLGRMTLNPIKHLDPVGFLMLAVVGFGFAKPVPVNPYRFRKLRTGIFTVAIAGITMNILLAILFSLILVIYITFGGAFLNTNFGEFLWWLFYLFIRIDISLFLFNLIPVFPLDGFRIVESFTQPTNPYCVFMRKYGQFILIGLIAISFLSRYVPALEYIDVLGFVLGNGAEYIMNVFLKFFQLFIH